MKTDDIKRKILLAESGELSVQDAARLEKRIGVDAEAHRYRADTRRVTKVAREALPTGDPGAAAMARIREAAGERAGLRPLIFRPALQVLAAAAALALLVSGWFAFTPATRTHTDRIADMQTILEIVAEDELPAVEVETTGEEDAQLVALARQLLIMQGLSGDDLEEMEYLPAELPTTDFQSRSTAAPPRQTRV
jgi:anti-sigma factor RsiW